MRSVVAAILTLFVIVATDAPRRADEREQQEARARAEQHLATSWTLFAIGGALAPAGAALVVVDRKSLNSLASPELGGGADEARGD